jgi:hypothetical protein
LDVLPLKFDYPLLCQCSYEGSIHSFVAIGENTAVPDSDWGSPEDGPLIHGPDQPISEGQSLSAEKLALFKEGNSVHADVGQKLDGPAGDFGRLFWRFVKEMRPQIFRDVSLKTVTYSDRYLRSPLPVRLLQEILRTMPDRCPNTQIEVLSSRLDRGERWQNYNVEDNWPNDAVRLKAMRTVLIGTKIQILNKRDCPHPRRLSLEWEDGRKAQINLDQGLGTWTTLNSGSQRFDVKDDPVRQASNLTAMKFEVRNRQSSNIDSPIWVSW